MTARERVMKTFRLLPGRPDRVPLQFDLCEQLLQHFSDELNIPLRVTPNMYEDVSWRISGNEIRLALGSEIVVTGTAVAADFEPEYLPDGRWRNEYGMLMRQGTLYKEVDRHPLEHVETVDDLANFSLPDMSLPGRLDDANRLVGTYHDNYFIVGGMGVTLMSLVQQLVGMEKLFTDMALGSEYLPELTERVVDYQIDQGRRLIDCGVDALFIGDDFGSQTSLLFSRQMFLDYWKRHYARMCREFKTVKPDVILVLHSDGAITPLLEDVHEIGFDVLNPIQPGVPGQSAQKMKQDWGHIFSFWGGLDEQYLIPKAPEEELDATIAATMKILGRDGGYVAAPAHIIQPDVAPERVVAFVECCRRNAHVYGSAR